MAANATPTELRNMQIADLQKEIIGKKSEVAKLALSVRTRKEKNSAKYQQEKKQLARMETVLTEKQRLELSAPPKKSTVSIQKSSSKAK